MNAQELGLRIVPIEDVAPHETFDPRRVERLSAYVREEGQLKNPPLVVESQGTYVILDGTTRTQALANLGYPHILVQVVEPGRARVSTWNHIVLGIDRNQLWEQMQALPVFSYRRLSGVSVYENGHRWAGGVTFADGESYSLELPRSATPEEEVEALNRLVALYTGEREILRGMSSDLDELREDYDDLTAVISFPRYTVLDILKFGKTKGCVPPGITRCIVPGRILRINLDLALLEDRTMTLEEKNEELNRYISARLQRQPLRYYEEPVYILED